MKNYLKKHLPKPIWNFLKKTFKRDLTYFELTRLLQSIKNPIFIDGGAHSGETIEKLQIYFPNAEIYAFEAIPELANNITKSAGVTIFSKALGEKERTLSAFNITQSSDCSSAFNTELINA